MSNKTSGAREPYKQPKGLQPQLDLHVNSGQHPTTGVVEQSKVPESTAGKASGQHQQLASGISAETERLLEGLLTPADSAHGSRKSQHDNVHSHVRKTGQSANTGSSGSGTSIVCLVMLCYIVCNVCNTSTCL